MRSEFFTACDQLVSAALNGVWQGTLMAVLVAVTVFAVAVAMYFAANWFAKPIRLVGESMAEIGKGRFDHRIHG